MREHRVYVDAPLAAGSRVQLPARTSQHLVGVLRLSRGAPVTLFNGNGLDHRGRLVETPRHGAIVAVDSSGPLEPAPPLTVRLGMGISRGEQMDYALQKAVELGVVALSPLFTDRTLVRLTGDRCHKRHRHWHGVVIAACEQSGRRRLPTLDPPTPLHDWLAQGQPGGLMLDPNSDRSLADIQEPPRRLTLLVGPEGGLSEQERKAARSAGFGGLRLGPRILRTETAPLAAIAAIQALWGDFR